MYETIGRIVFMAGQITTPTVRHTEFLPCPDNWANSFHRRTDNYTNCSPHRIPTMSTNNIKTFKPLTTKTDLTLHKTEPYLVDSCGYKGWYITRLKGNLSLKKISLYTYTNRRPFLMLQQTTTNSQPNMTFSLTSTTNNP